VNVIETLKAQGKGIRLTNGHEKWLVWHEFRHTWVVYERKYMARYTTNLIETESEEKAVAVLMKGE